MKILFVTEYFYPYIHGGGEISTEKLAKALCSYGEIIHILTPNYGFKASEMVDGCYIHRFPFPVKFSKFSDQLSPSWYFNPIYILILFFQIFKIVRFEKIQIIHVQSLFSLPSAVFRG